MSEGWWALVGVLIGAISSGAINIILQKRQFAHEKEMHTIKNQRTENVKSLLVEMLSHKSYTDEWWYLASREAERIAKRKAIA